MRALSFLLPPGTQRLAVLEKLVNAVPLKADALFCLTKFCLRLQGYASVSIVGKKGEWDVVRMDTSSDDKPSSSLSSSKGSSIVQNLSPEEKEAMGVIQFLCVDKLMKVKDDLSLFDLFDLGCVYEEMGDYSSALKLLLHCRFDRDRGSYRTMFDHGKHINATTVNEKIGQIADLMDKSELATLANFSISEKVIIDPEVGCNFGAVLHRHRLMKEGFKVGLYALESLITARDRNVYEVTKRLVEMVHDVHSKRKKEKKIQMIVKAFMACRAQKGWKDNLVLANQINSVGCKEEAFRILSLSMNDLTQVSDDKFGHSALNESTTGPDMKNLVEWAINLACEVGEKEKAESWCMFLLNHVPTVDNFDRLKSLILSTSPERWPEVEKSVVNSLLELSNQERGMMSLIGDHNIPSKTTSRSLHYAAHVTEALADRLLKTLIGKLTLLGHMKFYRGSLRLLQSCRNVWTPKLLRAVICSIPPEEILNEASERKKEEAGVGKGKEKNSKRKEKAKEKEREKGAEQGKDSADGAKEGTFAEEIMAILKSFTYYQCWKNSLSHTKEEQAAFAEVCKHVERLLGIPNDYISIYTSVVTVVNMATGMPARQSNYRQVVTALSPLKIRFRDDGEATTFNGLLNHLMILNSGRPSFLSMLKTQFL